MIIPIAICLCALLATVWLVQCTRVSLGLPVAYLGSLLLIHVPGGIAHLFDNAFSSSGSWTRTGVEFTAIASICFVVGVLGSRAGVRPTAFVGTFVERKRFAVFCLGGGWAFTYALGLLRHITSVGAIIDKGAALWMLGVIVGLRDALARRKLAAVAFWGSSLFVYPTLMLLLGGFLSYGSQAVIIVLCALLVQVRGFLKSAAWVAAVAFLGLSLFVSYFAQRDDIRDEVWGGAPLADRVDQAAQIFTQFQLFNPYDEEQRYALDQRLNQNLFVGMATERLETGLIDYRYGVSVWEALIAPIPRALWPSKPVAAGSGDLVRDMTGLELSRTTSWGVGNVMEFHINFGVPGIVGGFLILGWLIGFLDLRAAQEERAGRYGNAIIFFLPAVALIQPNGSMVEMGGGAVAAWLAALGWKKVWQLWNPRRRFRRTPGASELMTHQHLPAGRQQGPNSFH